MPLTEFQKQTLTLLAANRSPDSYVAGGVALHASRPEGRYSRDADIFHDAEESVIRCSRFDEQTLVTNGYSIEWLLQEPTFRRALVSKGGESLRMDWAQDSACRFFPVEADPILGWRLHPADLATNKALALASRSKTRDLFDIVMLDKSYLRLEAIIWASCGKDEGFNPVMMLEMMARHARIHGPELEALTTPPADPVQLKSDWLNILDRSRTGLLKVASENYGFLLLDSTGQPHWPENWSQVVRHYPTVGGAWPAVSK